MAVKTGKKRASSPTPASPAKKGRAAVAQVVKALKEVGPWSPTADVVTMLSDSVQHTLAVPKDERHQWQEKVVGWIGVTLASYEAGMQKEADELAAKCADGDGEKATREATKAEKESNLASLKEAVEAAHTTLNEREAAKTETAAALVEAEKAKVEGDAEYEKAAGNKERLELADQEAYLPLKGDRPEPLPDMTEQLKRLAQLGKEFKFDEQLLTTLPAALKKEPAARGSFDNMVMKTFEDALSEKIAELAKVLADGQGAKDARAAAVDSAKAASDAACEAVTAATEALAAAKEAQKNGEVELKEAARAVKDFLPEMKAITSKKDVAAARVKDFQEGPLATFAALKDPPPPPEPAAPEAAEAAPTEAAPVDAA